jgi:cytochrome c
MKKLLFFAIALVFCDVKINAQAPDETRFTKIELASKLDEPMEMAITNDAKVYFIERKGALKLYDPNIGEVKTIATIPVNTKFTNAKGVVREAEEGLVGLAIDPNFEKNNWVYMLYAHPTEAMHELARWELKEDKLIESSKKVVLNYPVQRRECCHTGGGMEWDKAGNLFITTGNNTSNSGTPGYANLDERKGWEDWDDQRGAGNTNDLRGKILRIKPENDGTYSIPKGNLYETLPNNGDGLVRKEIYTMGHRNPWRVSVDSKTGYIYWGEVGPDASVDGEQGPRGYDEFNQAKGPGNFGWPYFIGGNYPYPDWDFETNKLKPNAMPDPMGPINDSPNNTGLKKLPPVSPPFIWYPYGISEQFPLMGASGRSATGGPVFRKDDFKKYGKRIFPAYYEGKWLMVEFMRGWIMAVSMDEKGDYKSMERFMPNTDFGSAIDMRFAPDGDLYVLEYGSAWFRGNDNAKLVKVEYNAGNRMPKVVANADIKAGAAPLKAMLSSKGSLDPDGDKLSYLWEISNKKGVIKKFMTPNPTYTFAVPGTYNVTLTLKDGKGEENAESFEVIVGNEPPKVALNIKNGNKTFYFPNKNLEYEVDVTDKEDGSLKNGKIKDNQVAMSIDYLPIGYDKIEPSQNHRGVDAAAFSSVGARMIAKNDCKSCHIVDKKSVGPSYKDVGAKYKGDPKAMEYLTNKIIKGGGGVWGDHVMAAHPQISQAEANIMVEYILGINEPKSTASLPTKGNYETKVPKEQKGASGSYIIRAAYKDKGSKTQKSLATEDILVLRNPVLNPELADLSKGTNLVITPGRTFSMVGNNSYLGYKNIDLNGISAVEFSATAQTRVGAAGGSIELRAGSPTGALIGQTEFLAASEFRRPQQQAAPSTPPAGGQAAPTPPAQRPVAPKLKIPVPANSGQQDIYFVFKSEKATDNQIVMSLSAIEFKAGE